MDQQLTCIDYNQPFTFTQGEQDFYAGHSLTPPKRCKPCRDAKKQRQAQGRPRLQNEPRRPEMPAAGMGQDDDGSY